MDLPPDVEAMKIDPATNEARQELDAYRVALEGGQSVGADPRLEERLLALLDEKSFPGAFLTQAKRLAELCRKIHTGDVDSATSRARLAEGLSKLLARWPVAVSSLEVQNVPPPPSPPSSISDMESSQGGNELITVFLQGQQDRLQEFEALVLEKEKGNAGALPRLLGLLHNLKGEYGVLGFSEWADLIHGVESLLTEDRLLTDDLLQLVDALTLQASELGKGSLHPVPPAFRTYLGRPDPVVATPVAAPVEVGPSHEEHPDQKADSRADSKSDSAGSVEGSMAPWIQDPSFLVDFQTESLEHIRAIEIALLRLETSPSAEDALHSAFRAFHTIKGLASFLKLGAIRKLSHAAESVLDLVRRRELVLCSAHVDVLLVATDALRHAIAGLDTSAPQKRGEPRELVSQNIMDKLLHPETVDTTPSRSDAHGPEATLGTILVQDGSVTETTIGLALQIQSHGDDRPLGEILVTELQVPAKDVGQALGQQARARQESAAARAAEDSAASEAKAPKEPGKEPSAAVEDSIRVPVDRLDQLIDAIGESVIAQSMVFGDPLVVGARDLALEKKMASAAMMLRRIQELSMSLRMVAIRQTFQKMSRLVRDLSRKQGKLVDLELDGEATELDKTVVENIGDPLVHMVRNSVDHGLETAEQRRAAGKPERGRIVLRAFHKAGSVHVEIEDDGRGLNRARILEKAVAAGIVKPGQDVPDQDVWRLIFHPGLSTAEKVTDISGRGVGMDVVKRNIESLRGTIDIRSTEGRGTCFTIRLPLTLAIIGGMVIRVGPERYIIPTLSVHATLRPTPDQISTVKGKGELLNLRGELLPLIRLHDQFDLGREQEIHEGVVLVVEDAMGRKTGLAADEILDQQQVVVKTLGAGVSSQGLTGAAIMNDGTVSLILDVAGVVRAARCE